MLYLLIWLQNLRYVRNGGYCWAGDKNVIKNIFRFPELKALAASTNRAASVFSSSKIVCITWVVASKPASWTEHLWWTNWRNYIITQYWYFLIILLRISTTPIGLNFSMTEAVIIWKPVHWFAEQIDGLVSIW